jgi:hypothetical protein
MDLMDSPAAFPCRNILLPSDQNAWQAKARFLVGGEGYYATPSRVLMHWGAFSGGWWLGTSFLGSAASRRLVAQGPIKHGVSPLKTNKTPK